MEYVYVAFLNAEVYSKVLGVYKNQDDALKLCKKEAQLYADELFTKDYKYQKIYYDEMKINVDTFVWEVVKTYIQ